VGNSTEIVLAIHYGVQVTLLEELEESEKHNSGFHCHNEEKGLHFFDLETLPYLIKPLCTAYAHSSETTVIGSDTQ